MTEPALPPAAAQDAPWGNRPPSVPPGSVAPSPAPLPPEVYRSIVEGAEEGVWMIDAHARTTYVNRKMAAMLGVAVDDMHCRPLTDFIAPGQLPAAAAALQRRADGVAEQHPFEFRRSDGSALHAMVSTHALSDAQGRFTGAVAMITDVGALHRIEQELRASRAQLQATLDGLSAHVCVLDDAGTIVSVNRTWREFGTCNGADAAHVGEGCNYLAVCEAAGRSEGDAREFAEGLCDVLAGRRAYFEMEYPCHSPTEQRWFMVSVSRLEGAEPARVVVAHQSITARKLAEHKIREVQKMESLGTLAGGIAHDFNNILGAILGNAAMALDDLPTAHPVRQPLEQIRRAGLRARHLVHQILAFSRGQPHQAVRQPVGPLIEETLSLLRSILPAQVTLSARLPPEPVELMVDATHVQQIVMNLCTNAWHALDGRAGHVEVGLDTVPAAAAGAAVPSAHLWVADDGRGMDDETRARIFDPFYTTKPVGTGTGLGLSVVHGIVAEHHGVIRVDTAPGRGSTFHVYLPLATPAAVAPAPPAEMQAGGAGDGGPRRIVLVDDDEVVGLTHQLLLERAGHAVRRFDDAVAALEALRESPAEADLLVTDYSMPGMSGLALAAAAHALRADLPVIVVSGFISDELQAGATAGDLAAVVPKEQAFEMLAAAVRAVPLPGG